MGAMKIYISLLVLMSFWSNMANAQNTLQYYLTNAEQNSPLLQKQENNRKIIGLDVRQFEAIYKSTKIDINSNVIFAPILSRDGNTNTLQWTSSGSTDYIGYDLGATNGGQYQALVSVNQPLFTQKFSDVKQAQADVSIQKIANLAILTKAELNQTVTHQYILCVLTQKQVENALQIRQIFQTQLEQMKAMVNAGVYRLIDLKRLEIELKNNQLEIENIQAAYAEKLNALNLLCGIKDTGITTLHLINLALNYPNKISSIFTQSFRLDSLSLLADQKISNLQYLPQVSAFADAGLNATYSPTPNRMGFSVGLAFKWNLFDGHQKNILNDKINLQSLNIETDRQYFENQNNIRKQNLLNQIDNINKQIELIDKQLSDYQNLLELYQTEISKGLISALELTTLVKDIAAKQQVKTNLEMSKQIVINAYNYWDL